MTETTIQLDIKDESLRTALHELGGVREEYKPSVARLLFGYTFAMVLVGGSIVLAVGMPLAAGRSWFWLFALLGVPVGVGVFLYIRFLSATRIYVCKCGIVHTHGSDVAPFPWNRVVKIEQHVMSSNLPVHGALGRVPVGQLSTYLLSRDDGEVRGFSRETVSDARRLAEHVAEQADVHNIAWQVVHDD